MIAICTPQPRKSNVHVNILITKSCDFPEYPIPVILQSEIFSGNRDINSMM